MQLSTLLLVLVPDAFQTVLLDIQEKPGHSVHHLDEATHRAIVVIEAPTEQGLCEMYEALENTPGILSVSLVNHVIDDDVTL